MQYDCIYKQITCLNRTRNLTMTKQTTKIKKQKDTVNNSCKYWLWYLLRLLTFQTSFKNSFQTKNKFQIFKLFTKSFWNKGQNKKRYRIDKNNCLMAASEGNSWIAKPKLEKLPLIFWRFFETSYAVDTH